MSNSVRPRRRQPTRLPHPWDSPGKNTGVGCHFLLQPLSHNQVLNILITLWVLHGAFSRHFLKVFPLLTATWISTCSAGLVRKWGREDTEQNHRGTAPTGPQVSQEATTMDLWDPALILGILYSPVS